MKNWSSWYKLVFLQSFFLALYTSKTTPDSDELPYTSCFFKSLSSHHSMFSFPLCPTTSTLHPSGSLSFSWEFYSWQFLGVFPNRWKKPGSVQTLCRCQRTNPNLALGMLNLVDPHMKGARSGVSFQECLIAEQAETWLHSPWATCTFNLFLPTKYAAKHLFVEKNVVCVRCFKSGTPILSKEGKPEEPMLPVPLAMKLQFLWPCSRFI